MSARRGTISNERRARVKGIFEPIALVMGRAGLTPDALTLTGFGITLVGAVLLSQQLWLPGGLVVFAGGVFDMLDGTLARATGRVSRLGAFMDSVFDRWGEAVVYLGLIAGLLAGGWADAPVYAGAAMGAAFMVSYVRARAEGLGFSAGTGMAAVGIMPREVRLVVLTLGLVLAGVFGTGRPAVEGSTDAGGLPGAGGAALPLGILTIEIALAIIALGATITVIQRILHVRAQDRQQALTNPPTAQHEQRRPA
ncbi:MAG: CDP-alcohol phosphatidyltransferase family protein [Chloroflexi bacterium]|nr:CDP-alcohol phosphatidyltransferase family protein [Chloroflexota bacterium]